MWRTFNCGIGVVLIVAPAQLAAVSDAVKAAPSASTSADRTPRSPHGRNAPLVPRPAAAASGDGAGVQRAGCRPPAHAVHRALRGWRPDRAVLADLHPPHRAGHQRTDRPPADELRWPAHVAGRAAPVRLDVHHHRLRHRVRWRDARRVRRLCRALPGRPPPLPAVPDRGRPGLPVRAAWHGAGGVQPDHPAASAGEGGLRSQRSFPQLRFPWLPSRPR
ncbi:hypothetical protein G6F68_010127 [Rhizopus microsporus]|nr:hypothetical protein G6F68_010127 [Rhizopus microsporus]